MKTCFLQDGIANVLPSLWQTFAIAVANFCHRSGKLLPSQWQDFAIVLARSCHYDGRTLAIYQQKQADTSATGTLLLSQSLLPHFERILSGLQFQQYLSILLTHIFYTSAHFTDKLPVLPDVLRRRGRQIK